MANPPGTLSGNKAMVLFQQGKDAWNQWANQHPGWLVDFSGVNLAHHTNQRKVSFDGYIFPGPVSFDGTDFGKMGASFEETDFRSGKVSFADADFRSGDVSFKKSRFGDGNKCFRETKFDGGLISFVETNFGNGDLDFEGQTFGNTVNFSYSRIEGGQLIFKDVTVTKGSLNFDSVHFTCLVISFISSNINSGNVIFSDSCFDDGVVMFNKFNVHGNFLFQNATFKGQAFFFIYSGTENGFIDFEGARFESEIIDFTDAICGGDFYLKESVFNQLQSPRFNGLKVNRTFVLDESSFSTVPDLRNIATDSEVSMIGMKVKYRRKIRLAGRAGRKDHSDMYRKLKSIAIQANDHQRELEFFAMEEKAKFMWHRNPIEYFPTFLYGLLSNFGYSLWRPIAGLFVTGCSTAACFQYVLSGTWSIPGFKVWFLSLLYLLPFVPGSRDSPKNLICTTYKGEPKDSISTCVEVIERFAFAEGFFALLFLFLIGLALRNRFRL